MSKHDTTDLLFMYLSGALSDEDAQQVRDRCAKDPAFAEELELTRAAMGLFGRHRPPAPRPYFWTRLSTRIETEETGRQAWIWVAKRLIPSMVVVTLLVTAVIWRQAQNAEAYYDGFETALLTQDDSGMDEWLMDGTSLTKEALLESALAQDAARSE